MRKNQKVDWTPQLVENLAASGLTQKEAAEKCCVCLGTLHQQLRRKPEIRAAWDRGRMSLSQTKEPVAPPTNNIVSKTDARTLSTRNFSDENDAPDIRDCAEFKQFLAEVLEFIRKEKCVTWRQLNERFYYNAYWITMAVDLLDGRVVTVEREKSPEKIRIKEKNVSKNLSSKVG